MHIPTLGEIVALVLMGVLLAAVLHAGRYNKHRRRSRAARLERRGAPKKGDRVRLLVGIPELKLPIGSEGRITTVHVKDYITYFIDFGERGVTDSVVFNEHEAWRFEVLR